MLIYLSAQCKKIINGVVSHLWDGDDEVGLWFHFPFPPFKLSVDFMGKLKVLDPSLDWVFTLILSTKTNRTIMSHVSYPSRKCTSLFDLNFSKLWIYIGFVLSSNIHWEKEKKSWSTLLLIMPVVGKFSTERETRRLLHKGVSTSGSTLSTFFLMKFLREGQCSTALAQGNN